MEVIFENDYGNAGEYYKSLPKGNQIFKICDFQEKKHGKTFIISGEDVRKIDKAIKKTYGSPLKFCKENGLNFQHFRYCVFAQTKPLTKSYFKKICKLLKLDLEVR